MLNKYWNSPALALTIEPSATRRKLLLLASCAVGWSIALVGAGGHAGAASSMALLGLACLGSLYREPYCSASLGWRAGQFLFIYRGKFMAVALQPGWVCLPFVLRLTLREPVSGSCLRLWLFRDSAEAAALLRLRRRLTLER